jgi:multidrug efflux pump subunit AcrA (membrane-fusion protein)
MPNQNNILTFIKKQPRWRIAGAILILALGFYLLKSGGKSAGNGVTFTVRRGPLDITVLEGGSIQALESQEVKCEVRVGYQGTKILKIVEEGYQVTEDDVRTNKVLVELDSSELQKQITQQEIQYQSAAASLIDAQQGYEIQLIQNLSDTKAAEQKARFARMDFDKFLGDITTREIIEQLGMDKELSEEQTNAVNAASAVPPTLTVPPNSGLVVASAPGADAPKVAQLAGGVEKPTPVPSPGEGPKAPPPSVKPDATAGPDANAGGDAKPKEVEAPKPILIDFSKYAQIEALGDGEAKQKLRKFEDDLQVAKKELGQAKATLDGTRRLHEKGFVTKTDLERDDIAHENSRLKVQTAETASDLFLKYEFTKSAEESLSKFAEAVRELDKARRSAISKLAQADAKLKSAQGQYNIQLRQRKELNEQLEKCTIQAKKTGIVVYGGGRDDMYYYGGEERIREGATVRERQAIITIPDMTKMSLNVKIHESYIKKVRKGQKVRITVEAFPDQALEGEVTKVGVLPDSQNRWMNPDLKVYLTTITINGTHDWIKPGMSAKAEIMVNQLPEVVYVPIQAVSPSEDKQVCYVIKGLTRERREVEVGEFNDNFIEVKKGLKEGEKVLLRPPEAGEPQGGDKSKEPKNLDKEKPKPEQSSPPSTAMPAGRA